MDKHLLWAGVLLIVIFVVCITAMWIAMHPYVMRFEMDDNTLQAVKSINWSSIPRGAA